MVQCVNSTSDAERIKAALKCLYIHLGEAQGALCIGGDDTEEIMYSNQKDICEELINILENKPTITSATSSTVTYRYAKEDNNERI